MDSIVDLWLLFSGEIGALDVATALDVEDTSIRPDVLVVTNELSSRIRREGGLACTGESKEERDIALLLVDIGRGG